MWLDPRVHVSQICNRFFSVGSHDPYSSQIFSHTCIQTPPSEHFRERVPTSGLWIAAVAPPHILCWSGFVLQGTRQLRDNIRLWSCNYWVNCFTDVWQLAYVWEWKVWEIGLADHVYMGIKKWKCGKLFGIRFEIASRVINLMKTSH